jgi:hypothetical protein
MHREQDVAAFSARSGAARRPVADTDARRPPLRLSQEAQRFGDLVKDATALTLQLLHLLWSTPRRTLSGRVSTGAAHIEAVRSEWKAARIGLTGEYAATTLAQMDEILRVVWPKVVGGGRGGGAGLGAIDRALAALRLRAELMGLNEPAKMDVGEGLASIIRAAFPDG